jgi:hypothetical protein
MLDLNNLRDEFSRYIHDNTGQRHSMDGALMHVCRIAYDRGIQDGLAMAEQPPASDSLSLPAREEG